MWQNPSVRQGAKLNSLLGDFIPIDISLFYLL